MILAVLHQPECHHGVKLLTYHTHQLNFCRAARWIQIPLRSREGLSPVSTSYFRIANLVLKIMILHLHWGLTLALSLQSHCLWRRAAFCSDNFFLLQNKVITILKEYFSLCRERTVFVELNHSLLMAPTPVGTVGHVNNHGLHQQRGGSWNGSVTHSGKASTIRCDQLPDWKNMHWSTDHYFSVGGTSAFLPPKQAVFTFAELFMQVQPNFKFKYLK